MYEYFCGKCKENYTQIKTIKERDNSKCPKCDTKGTRLIAAPPFHLKGTGWHETDYPSKSGRPVPPPQDVDPKQVVKIPEYTNPETGEKTLGKPKKKIEL